MYKIQFIFHQNNLAAGVPHIGTLFLFTSSTGYTLGKQNKYFRNGYKKDKKGVNEKWDSQYK